MYKALIFDFFGVFCPDATQAWLVHAVPEHGVRFPQIETLCTQSDYGSVSRKDFYERLAVIVGKSVEEVTRGIEAKIRIDWELVDYVRSLDGYKVACLSNGTQEWTNAIIEEYAISDLFDEIIVSGDLGIIKPDAEIYLYTLKKLGVQASQAIFVDDRQPNVLGGEACGIRSILFKDIHELIRQLSMYLVAPK